MIKPQDKIDFVILWVDSTDKEWLKEKQKYEKEIKGFSNIDLDDIRYRDWNNLKYWFRGVEKFAPWVNKIHFITCGHLPEWLDTTNPKLHIVKHSDYMPEDALPTFNSNAIEMMIHKIEGLSEQFVLFNDDMFLIKNTKKTDFFKKGLPCNTMSMMSILPSFDKQLQIYRTVSNNMELINKNFKLKQCLKSNFFKYFSIKQGKYLSKTIPMFIYKKFSSFGNYHICISYLKSTWQEVWEKEGNILMPTVYSKFRDYNENYSHWLYNYWQFASGKFAQKSWKFGKLVHIDDNDTSNIIENQKCKCVCLSDSNTISNFEEVKERIINSFEKILPEKSSFEL